MAAATLAIRSGRASKAKPANRADHSRTQANNKWPSAQLSINCSAMTSKAANTAADKRPARVREALAVCFLASMPGARGAPDGNKNGVK